MEQKKHVIDPPTPMYSDHLKEEQQLQEERLILEELLDLLQQRQDLNRDQDQNRVRVDMWTGGAGTGTSTPPDDVKL